MEIEKMKYSAQQLAVIETEESKVQVLALAGVGKTTTMCGRVDYLVQKGVYPAQILALSFSNDAVNTLRNRLVEGVSVYTFHSLCQGLARDNYVSLGYSKSPFLIDNKKVLELLKDAIRKERKKLSKKHASQFREFARKILTASGIRLLCDFFRLQKTTRKSIKKLAAQEVDRFAGYIDSVKFLKNVQVRYQEMKRKRALLEYCDMVAEGIQSLRHGESVKYKYLLVDEYQDCTLDQLSLLKILAELIPNVMVVGDAFQAIYGFAGACYTDLSNIINGVVKYELTESHRLTKRTADFASAVVNASSGNAINLVGTNGNGKVPKLIKCKTARVQEQTVTLTVKNLIERGIAAEDIAILGRTKAQLRNVGRTLKFYNVNTSLRGCKENRLDVYQVLHMVRRLERCADCGRVPTIPSKVISGVQSTRDIPANMLKDCARRFKQVGVNPSRTLESRYLACIPIYVSLMGGKNPGNADVVTEINDWVPISRKFDSATGLKDHIENYEVAGTVVMSTIHRAKGHEWKYVLIIDVTDGSMPFFKAKGKQALNEELNLMYVAITRAKCRVFLFHAPYDNARAKQHFENISPYVQHNSVRKLLRAEKGMC